MRLFVKHGNRKVYLRVTAKTRNELSSKLGKRHFTINGKKYTIKDVYAEPNSTNIAVGAIFGGLIGSLAGPFGAITGGTIGGLVGNTSDTKEKQEVLIFNKSKA